VREKGDRKRETERERDRERERQRGEAALVTCRGLTPAAGTAIATVAAFTYCGSIVAPPMIGAISQSLDSLR
jgi:hypothetical protein